MSRPRTVTPPSRLAVLLSVGLLAAAPTARADDAGTSLRWAPADAAFYGVMLRNREQVEAVIHSKAWARLHELPVVRQAHHKLHEQFHQAGGPLRDFLHAPENKELVHLAIDMVSDEVFALGGPSCVTFADVFGRIVAAMQFDPALFQQHSDEEYKSNELVRKRLVGKLKTFLDGLDQHKGELKAPDLVFGFRVRDTDRAATQLKRLEGLVREAAERNELLKGRVSRTAAAGGDFLTINLDGGMVPWGKILDEDDLDTYEDAIKKLKGVTLTVGVGTWKGYVVVAIGPSLDYLGRLGEGERLTDRPELKPLAAYASRPLTSVSYLSKALAQKVGTTPEDVERGLQTAAGYLDKAGLPSEMHDRMAKDLKELGQDLKGFFPEPGASLEFSFLNGSAVEGFAYNWGAHPRADASKPLSLLHHVGGSPILAAVSRRKPAPERYDLLVKWLGVADGYVQDFVLPIVGEEKKAQYERVSKLVRPFLRRVDAATRTKLLPALADGQGGFVLDAKLTSKRWYSGLPPADPALPLPEPALVMGLSDARAFRAAFAEYRAALNELILAARDLNPGIPPFQVPEPEDRTVKDGTIYYYPNQLLQMLGVDPQLRPTAGISEHVFSLAISSAHAERLLADTPLAAAEHAEAGPLAEFGKPLSGAAYLDWPELVDAARPWVDLAVRAAAKQHDGKSSDADGNEGPGVSENPPAAKPDPKEILDQAHTVLDILKCFRRYASCTYRDGDALVTHAESVFHDLP